MKLANDDKLYNVRFLYDDAEVSLLDMLTEVTHGGKVTDYAIREVGEHLATLMVTHPSLLMKADKIDRSHDNHQQYSTMLLRKRPTSTFNFRPPQSRYDGIVHHDRPKIILVDWSTGKQLCNLILHPKEGSLHVKDVRSVADKSMTTA